MVADTSPVDSPPVAGSPLPSAFLKDAIAVYQILVSVHRDDVHGDGDGDGDGAMPVPVPIPWQDLADLSARLNHTVAALGDDHHVAAGYATASVVTSCLKVGQDLCLKLKRHVAANRHDVDLAAFREMWPAVDVEALGARLHELVGLAPESGIPFKVAKIYTPPHVETFDDRDRPQVEQVDEKNDAVSKIARAPRKAKGKGMLPGPSAADLAIAKAIAAKSAAKPRLAPASLLYDFLLESLAYKTMHDREGEVVKAHKSTFEWVFSPPKSASEATHDLASAFTTWLATNGLGPTYWITGKPGSGKSTFMRYIFQNPATTSYLQRWAEGKPIAMAGFFFWTSGSRDQRSQTGLLRSLLHQLLSQDMDLIPQTFSELWQKLRVMTTKERILLSLDWSVKDLLEAFNRLMDAATARTKICLFVDGLDEFEGDHLSLIHFFRDLGLRGDGRAIKMCLASRPWSVFENAFEHAVPHMALQDVTYVDMHRYVADKLREDVRVRRVFDGAVEEGDAIVHDTVQRADGVFLWVRLAVNEIIARCGKTPDAAAISSILKQLPTELDDLFYKLLFEDQTADELAETSTIFQLIRAREIVADFVRDDSANSLTVWEFAFALAPDDDECAASWEVEEATDEFIYDRCVTTVQQITLRFARLLDMHRATRQGNMKAPRFTNNDNFVRGARVEATKRVTYIHRTVRDWLMEADGVYKSLLSRSPRGFDPHLRLLRSYVLRLKRPLEEIEPHRRLDEWYPDIALAMTHARHITMDPLSRQRPFVNALNSTISWLWMDKPQDPYDHWARTAFGSYEVRMKASPIWQPFLCLAVKFGLTRYVMEEVDARNEADHKTLSEEQLELERDDATPLLSYATEFICSRKKTMFPLSDPSMVEYLLQHPCRVNRGPNHEYSDFNTRKPITPWLATLRHLRDARRRGWVEYYDTDLMGTARWTDIVRLLIEAGADVDAVVLADTWDPEITAVGVLELLDETYGDVEVGNVRDLMVQKQNSVKGKHVLPTRGV